MRAALAFLSAVCLASVALAFSGIAPVRLEARKTFTCSSLSDNFTGPDNTTLGGNWIDRGSDWGIISNSATENLGGSATQAVAWWNPATNTCASSQFSQVTCSTYSGQQCGVAVNFSGANLAADTGYVVFVDAFSNTWGLYRQDAGPSYHALATGSVTPVDGDVLYLENNAGTITYKRNGSVVTSQADATYSGGQPGMNLYNNGNGHNLRLNTWSGGDLGGGTTFPGAIINAPVRGGGVRR